MAGTSFFDKLENRSEDARAEGQSEKLRAVLAQVAAQPGSCLPDVGAIKTLADLPMLPVLRKSDLSEWQKAQPPFGGMAVGNVSHVFQSPGPIYEPGRICLLYTSPSPRDKRQSRMPSSA